VSAFVDSFARLGYDTKTLLNGVGMEPALLRNPDALIPCQQFGALIGAAQTARPMRNLMLHLAAATPIGAFPLLDYLILTCGTVGEGLTQLARFLRFFGNATQVGVCFEESPPRVTLDDPGNAASVEFTTAIAVLHLKEETEGRFSPIAVHFAPTRGASDAARGRRAVPRRPVVLDWRDRVPPRLLGAGGVPPGVQEVAWSHAGGVSIDD
jgi:hypothetical protein